MICEACRRSKTKILDTRSHRDPGENFHYTLRRHRCYDCQHIFWTVELPTANWEQNLKGEHYEHES
jgi:transcriptional regulator NrdR family protein